MNQEILHYKCQNVVRSAFEDYKHYIQNSIFCVDNSIIEIEISTLKQTIHQKTNSWFFDCDYSQKQYEFMEQILNYYLNIALHKCVLFGNKHK